MSKTQRIKDKKETIVTFRFLLTPSLTKSPQTSKAYVFLS